MEIVTRIAPIALALIMLGLGLGLTTNDFKRVLKSPLVFAVGITTQIILLPLVAFFLIWLIKVPLEIAVGVMIIAAAPGGVTSNVMTKFANGDVALSISLTAVSSIISIISVPIIVLNSAKFLGVTNLSQEITMTGIALKMAGVVTLPVLIGMLRRSFASILISNNIRIVEKITGFLFMMFIAYYIAKFFSSNIQQRKCIAIECGVQNGTLAVFVATQIFTNIAYIIPTAAYALIMYITAFIFIYLLKKTN